MKRRILLVSLLFLTISSLAVFAQTTNQQGGPSDTATTGQQGSGESQKCVDVTRKVGTLTQRYDESKNKYVNAFSEIAKNAQEVALKFKADGYDTTKLEGDLSQFNNMIQNTVRYYAAFSNGIENSNKGVCGNSELNATQEFTRAREQLMLCKTEMLSLKTFAQETLKQDLLDLRNQVNQ